MCEVNWLVLLEYIKVLLSWPPMALLGSVLVIFRFHKAINDLLARLVEGNLLGQAFKAVPPRDQQVAIGTEALLIGNKEVDSANTSLPPELANDPEAQKALEYVRQHPVETVIEYKRLVFKHNSERLFNLIYGTQIALLEFLNDRPTEEFALAALSTFHEQHQTLSGSTQYELRDYIGFLVTFHVLTPCGTDQNRTYRISTFGLEFLSHIKSQYSANWSKRAL